MIEKFLDFLFPKVCLNCGKQGESYLCSSCFYKLDLRFKIYPVFNKPYEFLIYLSKYRDEIRKKILEFKFYNKAYINEYFIEFLIKDENICDFLRQYDLIVPVPMYKAKKLRRGYNQTELIGRNLGGKLGIEYSDEVLIKFKENRTQSLLKTSERARNVRDVFNIQNEERIKGKNIILVDDIFTTGATVLACSRLLKKYGASKIVVLVVSKSH